MAEVKEVKEIHKDYMGKISWNRVNCGGSVPMFGSDIKTNTPVCISIYEASESTDPEERCMAHSITTKHPALMQIEMTPVQWAEFLTAGQVDDGVPCTITRRDGKRTSPVIPRSIEKDYNQLVANKFTAFQSGLDGIMQKLTDTINSGKTLGKNDMRALLSEISTIRVTTVANLEYAAHCFQEDMAKAVVKAKAEVNAYAETRLGPMGIKCLTNETEDAPDDPEASQTEQP